MPTLYHQIGSFLEKHRLGPEPINYEFAYRVLSNPQGQLAAAVYSLTDGGIRLTRKDMLSLGGQASSEPEAPNRAFLDSLVARTQMQVEGFQDLVRSVHAETTGFGRDLAASAGAIRDAAGDDDNPIEQLTSAMVERVRTAETRLEMATREAAELREKLDEARDNARRDPLTGLFNRRALEEAFAANKSRRTGQCLAICDIDRFKLVNDNFGHVVGDRVLRAIGEVIDETCRGQVVARFGGEEFAVLFTGVTIEDAGACLETARTTVASKRYRLRETDAPLGAVTFSVGLTAVVAGEPFETAFVRADRLLYQAKHDGRNRMYVG